MSRKLTTDGNFRRKPETEKSETVGQKVWNGGPIVNIRPMFRRNLVKQVKQDRDEICGPYLGNLRRFFVFTTFVKLTTHGENCDGFKLTTWAKAMEIFRRKLGTYDGM